LLRAVTLYQDARFEEAIAELGTIPFDPYSALLEARILNRMGQNSDSIRVLDSLDQVATPTVDFVLECEVLKVFPNISLHKLDNARLAIDKAKRLLVNEHSTTIETELYYVEGMWHFASENYELATRALNRALAASDDFFGGTMHPSRSVSVITHNRVKALQLLALIHSRQKQYHEQARLIRSALLELERSDIRDVYTLAILKMNLSFYVRDLDSVDDIDLLEVGSWPIELNLFAAEIDRSVGLLMAMQGRFDAFRDKFACAKLLSPSQSFKGLLVAEQCSIERLAFNHLQQNLLEEQFYSTIASLDAPDDYTQDAIFLVAQEISYTETAKGKQLLDAATSVLSTDGLLQLHDDRERADRTFSIATVQRNSNTKSVDSFFEAFETWNNVGYRKKAAMAAIELAELTHNPAFAAYARREAELRPGSWLDLRVRRMNV